MPFYLAYTLLLHTCSHILQSELTQGTETQISAIANVLTDSEPFRSSRTGVYRPGQGPPFTAPSITLADSKTSSYNHRPLGKDVSAHV